MKNVIIKFILAACIVGEILITEAIKVYAQEEQNKVIAIVYDNSSSMTFNDLEDPIETFRIRWVEADYALRAFLNCKDDEDNIMLYPLNIDNEDAGPLVVEDDNIEDMVNQVSSKFYGKTPYAQVENAVSDLKEDKYKEAEKWLIILTDGEFKVDFLNKLKETLGENEENISVLYVPMTGGESENSDKKNQSNTYLFENEKLEKFEGKVIQVHDESIQQQILQCNNIIYGRNILTLTSKDQGRQNIKIDVPLKELIVLIQKEGSEQKFRTNSKTDSKSVRKESDLQSKLENLLKELKGNTGDVTDTQKKFQAYSAEEPVYNGTELKDEMKDDPEYFINNLKTKDIEGCMAYLQWEECNISEENEIDFDILLDDNETIEIYYQLNFDLEIEVMQDGEIVKEGDLHEGEYEVSVFPVTVGNSKTRIATSAELLKDVNFFINDNLCEPGVTQKFQAVYGEKVELTAKASGSAIEDEISKTTAFTVKENIYPLKAIVEEKGVFDYDTMNKESKKNGTAPFLEVVLLEEGTAGELIGLRKTTIQNLQFDVNIVCDEDKKNEQSKIEAQIEIKDTGGNYYIYPLIINQNDNSVYHNVVCTITAYRKDAEEESICTTKVKLDLEAHEVPIQVSFNEDMEYNFWDCIKGNVDADIYCEGEEIPETEMKNIRFAEKDSDASRNIFGSFGNIFYWFFYPDSIIPVSKEVFYTRRGVSCMTVLEGTILYNPVPIGIRIMTVAIVIIIIGILIYIIIRELTGKCFSPFFKAYIRLGELQKEEERIKVRGKFLNAIIGRPITLVLSCDNDRKAEDFPDMKLKKVAGKAKMVVVNGDEFSNKQYRVDGKIIIADTIIDLDKNIKIIDSYDLHYELWFKTKEEVES